jgi:hypothetical protein
MSAKVAAPRKRSKYLWRHPPTGAKRLKTKSSHHYELTRRAWKRIARRRDRRECLRSTVQITHDAAGNRITKRTHCHRHPGFPKPCLICKLERILLRLRKDRWPSMP